LAEYSNFKISLKSKPLTGDIPYLTPEQLGKIEELNKKNKANSCSATQEIPRILLNGGS
jgi:hypothetical protein